MDEKELKDRAHALEVADRIHPNHGCVGVAVCPLNGRRENYNVPFSIGRCRGSGRSVGEMRMANAIYELEQDIVSALEKAEKSLREIACGEWENL